MVGSGQQPREHTPRVCIVTDELYVASSYPSRILSARASCSSCTLQSRQACSIWARRRQGVGVWSYQTGCTSREGMLNPCLLMACSDVKPNSVPPRARPDIVRMTRAMIPHTETQVSGVLVDGTFYPVAPQFMDRLEPASADDLKLKSYHAAVWADTPNRF